MEMGVVLAVLLVWLFFAGLSLPVLGRQVRRVTAAVRSDVPGLNTTFTSRTQPLAEPPRSRETRGAGGCVHSSDTQWIGGLVDLLVRLYCSRLTQFIIFKWWNRWSMLF